MEGSYGAPLSQQQTVEGSYEAPTTQARTLEGSYGAPASQLGDVIGTQEALDGKNHAALMEAPLLMEAQAETTCSRNQLSETIDPTVLLTPGESCPTIHIVDEYCQLTQRHIKDSGRELSDYLCRYSFPLASSASSKPAQVPSVSFSANATAGASESCTDDTTENEPCKIPLPCEPIANCLSIEHAERHIGIVVRLLSGENSELSNLTHLTRVNEVKSMVWDWAFERSDCVDSDDFDLVLVHNGTLLCRGNPTLGEVGVTSGDEIQLIGQPDVMPALTDASQSE
jgi:hypothetical protein